MDKDNKPSTLEKIQNVDVSKKAINKRVKRAEGVTLRHARKFIFKRLDNARESRRRVIIWFIIVALIVLASGIQLSWYRQSYKTTASAESGTYAEGVVGKISTLNPLYASTSAEDALSQLVFSRLINYDQSGKLNYDIAKSMAIGEDSKTYTFKIRDDVLWHDGKPLTVDDVIFTFDLLKDPATRSTVQGWSAITVTKIDSETVEFKLPSVIAPFPHALAAVPILPKHTLEGVEPSNLREASFSSKPTGSGPFSVSLVQDIDIEDSRRSVLLEKNLSYYKGPAKIDRFQLSTYPNTDSLFKAIKSGEVIAAAGLDSSQITQLPTNKYTIGAIPVNGGVYALFNMRKVTDKNVRQALQLATDTSKIREEFGLDLPALDKPITPALLGTNAINAESLNIAKANELLNQSGWVLKDGKRYKNGSELVLNVVTVKGETEKALKSLSSQWAEIGVSVNASIYDPTDTSQRFVQDILQPRNYDVLIYELIIGGDPDVYAYWDSDQAISSGYNFSNYSSSVSDAALSSARTRLDTALRQAKYQTFTRQWLADVPAIGLYQSVLYYAHSNSVSGFNPDNLLVSPESRYADVLYWTALTKSVYKTP